jgi:GNAT superfamily N-acetyltransferase
MHEWRKDGYVISTDPARLDIDAIHGFLTTCYWAEGIPRAVVEKSIRHSLPFGIYQGKALAGFARIITDYATYAYIGDVFVIPEHRGKGLSVWLMQVITQHPELQGLRRWGLLTRDAHELYTKVGFVRVTDASRYMERTFPGIYRNTTA